MQRPVCPGLRGGLQPSAAAAELEEAGAGPAPAVACVCSAALGACSRVPTALCSLCVGQVSASLPAPWRAEGEFSESFLFSQFEVIRYVFVGFFPPTNYKPMITGA